MSCLKKEIVHITDEVYLNPQDFSAIEYEAGMHSNNYHSGHPHGSIVTMKSGRKIFIPRMTPKEVMEKLQDSK